MYIQSSNKLCNKIGYIYKKHVQEKKTISTLPRSKISNNIAYTASIIRKFMLLNICNGRYSMESKLNTVECYISVHLVAHHTQIMEKMICHTQKI